MRASKVACGIQDALKDAQVTINAERPRKGVFEVRVGETVIVSTGPEPRPFLALKSLDVDAIARNAADTALAIFYMG